MSHLINCRNTFSIIKYVSCALLFSMLLLNCSTDQIDDYSGEEPVDTVIVVPVDTVVVPVDTVVAPVDTIVIPVDTVEVPVDTVIAEPLDSNLVRWDFNDLTGWLDGSQAVRGGEILYNITENGELYIFSYANTYYRPKVKTEDKIYVDGLYTWRVYLSEMGVGDQASVGAFLYSDDSHELDFEIGYGTSTVREKLGAEEDDLVAYMTSQKNPFRSTPKLIKREQWYDLTMDLTVVDGTYHLEWLVNGEAYGELDLFYGPETTFYIYCSMENLTFLGDHIPSQDNYALFDYVEYLAY